MLEIVICVLFGIIVGLFTGITPGIHVNTVCAFVLANTALFGFSDFSLAIFIVSLTVAHSILDFIPSIFLGIPSSDVLSILPGHKLTIEGRGMEAVKITSLGSIIGCTILFASLPILFFTIPFLYKIVKPAVPLILISIILLMIVKERGNFWKAIIIVILSSIFGILSLKEGNDSVLYAAFTGMFGISTMLFSLNQSTKFPEQKETKINLEKKEIIISSFFSFLSSTLLSLIPALGSSQAASVTQLFSKKPESFLLSLGVVNSCVGIVSIVSLILIGKARSGGGIAVEKLVGNLTISSTITFVIVGLVASILASLVAIYSVKMFTRQFQKINYKHMSIVIIIFLILLGVYFDGINGFLNMTIATLIGYLTIYFGVNRSHCMTFLMIPTLLFFLGFT